MHNPHRMRLAPFAPLPSDDLCDGVDGRLWLEALTPRAKGTTKSPFGRARAYARTAAVTRGGRPPKYPEKGRHLVPGICIPHAA